MVVLKGFLACGLLCVLKKVSILPTGEILKMYSCFNTRYILVFVFATKAAEVFSPKKVCVCVCVEFPSPFSPNYHVY